jgi:hypothetical protein
LGTPPSIDLGGSGQTLVMQNFNGYISWKNKTGASDQANASLNAGWIVLESSITAGTITLIGTGIVEDYSSGATVNYENLVNPHNITNHVWEDARGQLLYDIEGGRWKLENNQMIFYEDDNSTEVARFNLFDSNGSPTMENVYDRQRVPDDSWKYPYSLQINTGSITSGALSSVYTDNSVYLVLAEELDTPGFDYVFFFSRVQTSSLQIQLTGYYEGNPAHNVKWKLLNWSTYLWDDMTSDTTDMPSRSTDDQYNISVPLPASRYLSSQGHLFFKICHESQGTPGHSLNIDKLGIVEI